MPCARGMTHPDHCPPPVQLPHPQQAAPPQVAHLLHQALQGATRLVNMTCVDSKQEQRAYGTPLQLIAAADHRLAGVWHASVCTASWEACKGTHPQRC